MIQERVGATGVRFYVYVKGHDGRRNVYVGAYGSRREAREAEQEHASTHRKIERGELPPQVDLDRTVGEAVEEWLASLKKRKSRSEDGYRDRMNLYVLPTLRRVILARLTTAHVIDLRDQLAEKLAPATVNGTLTCLSSACTHFEKRGWMSRNPCRGVEPIENPITKYNYIRSREEITRLLAACDGDLRDMVAVALATGLRLDEMLHLQWPDIDQQRRLISVHRGRKGTVKSGKMRHVPILDVLVPVLRARHLRRGGAALVFPGEKGRVRSKSAVTTIYKLALKRAQLDESLRWHDLRHTFASHWVLDQGDIFRLSKILGHSSVRITEQRYAHLSPDAYEQDYHRVSFVVPTEKAKIYDLRRDAAGRIVGRDAVVGAAVA